MNFGFSDEQEMLRESARKLLEAECPSTFVREMMGHETGHSTEFWKKIAGLGWLGLTLPEELGGAGGNFLDAIAVLEETGRALMPGPFLATALLGTTAVLAAGSRSQKREILPKVAAGDAVLTLAFLEKPGRYDPAGIDLRARRKGKDFVLSGEKIFVYDAEVADWIVVAARTGGSRRNPEDGITLFLLEAGTPGLSLTPLRTIDMTRRQVNLELDGVVVPARRVLGKVDKGWPALRRAIDAGAVGISVETVGVAQRALEMSVAYAKERVQFGKPIGSFQAVKHKCVDMMVAIENARSLAYWAAWAIDENPVEARRAIPMAKAYSSDMGKNVTAEAIQVHGGIGFTWEHDMHLYYRRALANETAFGTAPLHRETVAQQLSL